MIEINSCLTFFHKFIDFHRDLTDFFPLLFHSIFISDTHHVFKDQNDTVAHNILSFHIVSYQRAAQRSVSTQRIYFTIGNPWHLPFSIETILFICWFIWCISFVLFVLHFFCFLIFAFVFAVHKTERLEQYKKPFQLTDNSYFMYFQFLWSNNDFCGWKIYEQNQTVFRKEFETYFQTNHIMVVS